MTIVQVMAANAALIAGIMWLAWIVSLLLRDASIVDILWGFGFVAVAWLSYRLTENGCRSMWLVCLTSLWGLRLSGYLAWRNIGKGEDYRYQAMRQRSGSRFWWLSLFLVFGLQGLIMWIVSLPVQVGQAAAPHTMSAMNYVGAAICLIGIAFESVGDFQLARFKADPKNTGKVMDRGLWRYTRHPNYFGDFLVWWGLFLTSLATQRQWWTMVSPMLMSFLLLKVSGVALLESNLKQRRPEYARYIRRTSAFLPWPPKEERADN